MSYLLASVVVYYFLLNLVFLKMKGIEKLYLGFMPEWVVWTMGGWVVLMVILTIWVMKLCKFFDESKLEE